MPENHQIKPSCRYDHGPLLKVTASGEFAEWAVFGADKNKETDGSQRIDSAFYLMLYVCKVCGYSEFFDSDPQLTATLENEQ
jgi:hypothetical protein